MRKLVCVTSRTYKTCYEARSGSNVFDFETRNSLVLLAKGYDLTVPQGNGRQIRPCSEGSKPRRLK